MISRQRTANFLPAACFLLCLLYHYEKEQGTTTALSHLRLRQGLYHYEKEQGTTTADLSGADLNGLYHYEKEQGTTTDGVYGT